MRDLRPASATKTPVAHEPSPTSSCFQAPTPAISLPSPATQFGSFVSPKIGEIISLDLRRDVSVVSLRDLVRSEPLRAEVIFEDCFRLYQASFPDPNELCSADAIKGALQSDSHHFDLVVLLENGRILGARQLSVLDAGTPEVGKFVIGEYMYVDRTERKRGIGSALVAHTEELMRSWGARIAISEQNDPDVMSPELLALDESAGISASQRRQFWKKQGYEGIDAPYVMPAISDDLEPVYHLKLAIRRLDPTFPKTLSAETLVAMLRAYHSTWVDDVDSNAQTVSLYTSLLRDYPDGIRIIDLEASRTCNALPSEAIGGGAR